MLGIITQAAYTIKPKTVIVSVNIGAPVNLIIIFHSWAIFKQSIWVILLVRWIVN